MSRPHTDTAVASPDLTDPYWRDAAYKQAAREVEEALRRALDAAYARLGIDPDDLTPQEGGKR